MCGCGVWCGYTYNYIYKAVLKASLKPNDRDHESMTNIYGCLVYWLQGLIDRGVKKTLTCSKDDF